MSNELAEAKAIVDDLIDPDTLSILDYIENEGTVLPSKTLTFYLDLAAGVRLREAEEKVAAEENALNRQRLGNQIKVRSIGDEDDVLDMSALEAAVAEVDEARAVATKSGIVFELKGVLPRTQAEIEEGVLKDGEIADDDKGTHIMNQVLARNLVKVTIEATGKVIEKFNAAVAGRLVRMLPLPDQQRFYQAVRVLNTAAVIADPQVDAGFPGEPTGVAQEPGLEDGPPSIAESRV